MRYHKQVCVLFTKKISCKETKSEEGDFIDDFLWVNSRATALLKNHQLALDEIREYFDSYDREKKE